MLAKETIEHLIKQAFVARKKSYCPYSGFAVGAALLADDGTVYTGCNIENSAYTPSNCAERTAFFKAVSDGVTSFAAIAVVGGKKELKEGQVKLCAPCGVCRQVMLEFCNQEFQVIMAIDCEQYEIHTLEELSPYHFSASNLTDIP